MLFVRFCEGEASLTDRATPQLSASRDKRIHQALMGSKITL